jgi:serine/threonine protein kinase
MTSRHISAKLCSTDVELHRRVDRNAVAIEASVLLECRHPNILLMLGFTLDLEFGPVVVMEKSWGSVSKVLYSQRLLASISIRIADQVASALHFLHGMRIHHGAVNIHNVILSDPPDHPRRENFAAKLTDFSNAKLGVEDNRVLDTDIRAYGVFTSNLFVEDISRIVRFDKGTLEVEQESIKLNLESIRIDHPALVALIMKLVTPAPTTAREIDERFSELHELLRSSIEKQYAKRAMHQPSHQVVSQPLYSTELEVQPVLRPAPYPDFPTSAQQMDSLLSRLALASPGESADIIRL